MKRINTRYSGVFYRETKIGKQSEGIDTHYCNRYRNEIITKQRLGEELPNLAKNKRRQK